ncbi:FcoT family thioesterase [Hyalangium versicolor]|uniref:FcoT family thioesterase n=1 Tax=Hyalangium versicolor TaxID=2861190 RepID=UPI001CD00B20|nr:FcoT family thioesterase [Hyalangium versicolor]
MYMLDEASQPRRIEGAQGLLDEVLKPYKPECRYLKSAFLEYTEDALPHLMSDNPPRGILTARGRFSIPESCYIASTGHFNAVEYNICYNQLSYYLLAECVQHRLLAPAVDWTYSEYLHKQLPDCLIVEFSSAFRKPIDSLDFEGRVSFDSVKVKSKATFIQTSCGFKDGQEGRSEGTALLALLHASKAAPH